MIHVGLTGWGDHPDVYSTESKSSEKLIDYSAHFPVVELDAAFYAVQPERNMLKWIQETPDTFRFVVKAYQGITGHLRGESPFDSTDEMFTRYKDSLIPLVEANKLSMVLVQFPPWFDCQKKHVDYIYEVRDRLQGLPLAIEFRHQSWYYPEFKQKTLDYLTNNHWIHSVCDEPQAGEGSIPLVAVSTNKDHVLVRLHGRNVHGWKNPGNDQKWREVRYLYDYNMAELRQIATIVKSLEQQAKQVTVLFNNNSGGHAANNAKQFMRLFDLRYQGLAPKQLDMFEGEW
ncbi:DUF72 domain-containing protein [Paenisporosarcina sp.]|uniref:DUF72 domain-containing protein n=1 Tax=Paenisporosarcina sp. TaxID=1932001 RepID=UPI003C7481B9